MKENKKRILWITRTAIFVALLIVLQVATKPLGQLVTGSLVNLILVMSVMTGGFSCGLTVAVISPVFAMLLGIGTPFWVLVPFIILGNCAIILVWHFIAVRAFSERIAGYFAALAIGAVTKFLVLYLTIVQMMLPFVLSLPEKQAGAITAAFSLTQLFTALIGGALAVIILPIVKKAIAARKG